MIEYYFENALKIVEDLSDIFDVARIVDPVECKIINLIKENGKVNFDEYMCYQVWNKGERCKNCISIQAHYLNKRMTKFEFVNDDVYHVIAKPIKLSLPGDNDFEFVLEMVNKVTDEILFEAFGKSEFIDKITAYEKRYMKIR